MAFLGKGKKQDMLQLAEELGINATLNMTVPSIKIAITNSEGYEEEFVKNLYETIIANGKDWKNEWLIGLEINTFQDLKDLMVVDQLKKRANASMKDHFLDNWANLKSATQIAELFDNYEDVRKGSVNGHEIDILRDTGATIDLVCAKYINPSSFSGENVWVKQPLSPELVCLPLAVVEISGNFGTVQTKAAVCGNHLNQHGRYLLGNKTAELIKGNLGYNFLPVEILNAVQTRSQVKAAREERGIDSGDAKKGKMRVTRENLINAQKNSEEIKPLYEQAASQVQVTNQVYSLEKELLVKNREDKLGNVVKSILLALRTVSHESTGYTPSELVYGKNLRTPETLVMEHWMEPEEEGDLVTEYMFKLINRLKRCQEVAINKMEEMQVKRKTWYDKNAVKREFKDGDLVLVLATSRANKLAVQWIGPGTILNKISETNYLVEIPGRRETSQIYHINMLKPYYKRPEHVNVIINDETKNSLADQELEIPYLENNSLIYDFEDVIQASELNKHLHDKQMDRLRELLNKYSKCFSNNPGLTNLVEHEIQYSGLLPKYINLFSVIAAPLTDALKGRAKKGEIKWTTECENAFRELKGKLIDKPVLYAPNFEREFIVQTDASNAGMGAVLTQLTEQGEEHPILYLSKKFSEVEKRYCTTEKECASIVFAIKRLHYYLDGNSFLVMTDHNPLVWLNRNVSSNPRLMRWALALQPYNFRIVHRSGKSHKNADSLSRSVIDN
ncbi:retrovirus-related Pol polyprotein from transposon 297 [Trichonephila clavipes]|nr:retrovirus-related Pol polyprotein from transposon 297 [Trichonephila clavipes]